MRRRLIRRAFPISVEAKYRRDLMALLRSITDDALMRIETADKPYLTVDSFSTDYDRILEVLKNAWTGSGIKLIANRLSHEFVKQVLAHANRLYNATTGGYAPTAFAMNAYGDQGLQAIIKLATHQNADLITSIASQHLDAISNIVYKNIMAGRSYKDIRSDIQSYGVTASRAEFIARDQTAKVVSTISRYRQESAGFEYFKWDTSHDERVRESHKEVANAVTEYGKGVYRWDDLPTIHGEKLAPGMDFRCRCVALPIADFEVEEWKRKHKK